MSKFNEAKKYINGYVVVTVVVSILVLFAAGGLYTYDYVEKNRNEVELTWDKSRIDFVNRLSNVVMHKNLINVVVPDTNKSGLPKEVGTRTYSGFTRISKDEISYTLKDGRTIIFDVNDISDTTLVNLVILNLALLIARVSLISLFLHLIENLVIRL